MFHIDLGTDVFFSICIHVKNQKEYFNFHICFDTRNCFSWVQFVQPKTNIKKKKKYRKYMVKMFLAKQRI